jgi:lipopolysaccharide/colanic/teichoic acid biosynthesis glycosyltransferase
MSWWQAVIKRTVDLVAGSVLLVLSAPIFVVAAALIAVTDGRPVFFRQVRVGRDGKAFEIVKFRTMLCNDVSVQTLGQVRGDNALVTGVGRFLRRFKIDEPPQLLSIVRGDMSMVGPRPTVPEQVAAYDEFDRRRLAVRPGATGLAQVSGNIDLTWPERILIDVWYVDHYSLLLDLQILAMTASTLLFGERRRDGVLNEAKAYAERTYRRR